MKKTITFFFLLAAFLAEASTTLNLKFFIEGYYTTGGMMRKGDTATVELHNSTSPYSVVGSFKGPFLANGTMVCTFAPSIPGNSYYIGVRTTNALQTWSAAPVLFFTNTVYDFTTAQTQAYDTCMVEVEPGVWAFWSGDINQDQNVDLIDYPALDYGNSHGVCGYVKSDLNGDGNVDLIDYAILDRDIYFGLFSCHP